MTVINKHGTTDGLSDMNYEEGVSVIAPFFDTDNHREGGAILRGNIREEAGAEAAFALNAYDETFYANRAVGAATEVQLPASAGKGQRHRIKDKKGDADTNNISIIGQRKQLLTLTFSGTPEVGDKMKATINGVDIELVCTSTTLNDEVDDFETAAIAALAAEDITVAGTAPDTTFTGDNYGEEFTYEDVEIELVGTGDLAVSAVLTASAVEGGQIDGNDSIAIDADYGEANVEWDGDGWSLGYNKLS